MTRTLALALTLAAGWLPAATQAAESRQLYVISDTHLGLGRVEGTGEWDPWEDFRWHGEFDEFINFLLAESGTDTDLVIAGDFLEMWQARDKACDHPDLSKDIACSEPEALQRASRITAQHQALFASLDRFLSGEGNTLTIVAGNHDAGLLYPTVSRHIITGFNSGAGQVRIPTSAYWVSQDGKVLVEHGQQLKSDVNRFADWPEPFSSAAGTNYLEKTWGEQFVQKFFNYVEDDLPLIDNIASELDGFIEGFNHSNWQGRYDALRNGVLFFIKHMSFSQAVRLLEEPPVGDVNPNKVRNYEKETFFYRSIPSDSPLYEATKQLVDEGAFTEDLAALSNEEIEAICGYRAAVYLDQVKTKQPVTLWPCLEEEPENLGAIAHGTLVRRSAQLGWHISRVEEELIGGGESNGIDTYIFGHTHQFERRYLVRRGDKRYRVLNTGAWQRVVPFGQLKNIADATPGANGPFSLPLEALPACYTFVSIPSYGAGSRPNAKLRKWGANCDKWGTDIPSVSE